MSIKSDQTVPDCLNKQIQTFIANENKKWQNKLEDENKKWQNKLEDENKKWQNKLEYENKKRQEKLADEIKKLSKKLDETIEKFEKKFAENQNVIRQLEKKIDQMQSISSNEKNWVTKLYSYLKHSPEENEKSSSYSYTRLAGLHNDHLRCYMNAGLQALSGSQLLLKDIDTIITSNNELVYLNELKELVCKLNETNDLSFYANKSILFNDWKKSGMQDTFELISHVMNTIIKEYKKKYNLNQFAWNKHDFPMVLKLAYKLTCASHHNQKTPLQTDLALHVPIPEKRGNITITDVLNEVVEGELISEYSCDTEGCKSKTGKKYIKLVEVPNILCIHIQRNKVTSTGSMSKNNKKITLESDTLELNRSFFQCENYNCSYKLCSVIDHSGSFLMSGHYICYKKFNNTWYCADDQSVYEVDFQKVKNCNMYVLIYELERKEIDEDISSSNDDSKFEEISQVINNAVLSMLLSSKILMKKLEYLQGFQLSKVNELVGALQDYRDNKKQTRYYDIKSTLNEVLYDILEPVKNEIKKASNCTSSNDIDIPLCLKLFIQTKCSRGHIRSEQELFEFTFTVTVNDNWGTKIALSKLMKDSVDGINISGNTCLQPPCPSNTVKKFVKFVKLPKILCIRIERRDSGRRDFQKIDADKTLKLDKKFFKDEDEDGVYKLRSVIVHSDSDSGPYKCYTYRDGKWVDDDNKILDYDEINERKTELLLYELVMEDSQSNNTHNLNVARSYIDVLPDNRNVDILNDATLQDDSNAVLGMLLSSEILMRRLEDLEGFQLSKVNELVGVLRDYRGNKKQTQYYDIKSTLNEMFTYILDPAKEEMTNYSLRSVHRATFPLTLDMCEITRCDSDSSHIKSEEYFTELFLSLSISNGGYNKISDLMDEKFRLKFLYNEKCPKSTKWVISSCKSPMKKYLKFEKLPTILCIQVEQNSRNKHAQITVDREIKLDKKYLKNENEEGVYKLRSVIVHSDSDSGQYKCYRYRDGKWVDGNKEIEFGTIKTNIEFLLYEFDEKSLLSKSRGSIAPSNSNFDSSQTVVDSRSTPQSNSNSKPSPSGVNSGSITPSNSSSKPSPTGVNSGSIPQSNSISKPSPTGVNSGSITPSNSISKLSQINVDSGSITPSNSSSKRPQINVDSGSITPSNSSSKPSPTGANSGSITPSNSSSKRPQTNVDSILTLISSSDVFMKSLKDFISKTEGARVREVEKLWSALESVRDNKVQGVYFDSRGNCLDLLKGILEGPMKEMDDAINQIENLQTFKNPLIISYDEVLSCYLYKHFYPNHVASYYLSLVVPENWRASNGKMNFNDFVDNWFGGLYNYNLNIACQYPISNYSQCSSMIAIVAYKMKYVPKMFIINLDRKSRSSMKLTIDKELIIKINSGSEFKYRLCGFLYTNGYGDIDVFELRNNEWFRYKETKLINKCNDHELRDIQPDLLIYEQFYIQSSV